MNVNRVAFVICNSRGTKYQFLIFDTYICDAIVVETSLKCILVETGLKCILVETGLKCILVETGLKCYIS